MDKPNMLSETTLKLKTKVVLFSGASLFIGLTKALPTKLSLIGLNLTNSPKILGWFILGITIVLFINFLILLALDCSNYFKQYIISIKAVKLTGDIVGLTSNEIVEEYKRTEENNQNERQGTLREEAEDITRKIKALEDSFDKKHLSFTNLIELFFNAVIPIVLTLVGVSYLYCFLNQ